MKYVLNKESTISAITDIVSEKTGQENIKIQDIPELIDSIGGISAYPAGIHTISLPYEEYDNYFKYYSSSPSFYEILNNNLIDEVVEYYSLGYQVRIVFVNSSGVPQGNYRIITNIFDNVSQQISQNYKISGIGWYAYQRYSYYPDNYINFGQQLEVYISDYIYSPAYSS